MAQIHLDGPCESDCIKHLQSMKTCDGMYLIVLASDGHKNISKLWSRLPRHIWRAVTSHGPRWAEYRQREGWRVTKEEPK